MAIVSMPNSPRLPSAAAPSRRWRDVAVLAGLLALVAAGLAGLAAATGWRETWAAMGRLTAGEVGVLLALSLANYSMRGMRWHLFAWRLGVPVRVGQNLLYFLAGFAMSVTPGRLGELVRMRWIGRETGWRIERAAPMLLADRAADLASMGLLLALALAMSAGGIEGGLPVAVLALAAAAVVTRPALLKALANAGHRATRRRWHRFFARIRRAARALGAFSGPGVLIGAGALGMAGWAFEGWALHLLLGWMGADLGFWTALGVFTLATLAGGLTGAPGGLGGAEAAMVALLALNNVPVEVAVPATLIIRLTTLWFAIGIGLCLFPLAERAAKRAGHALEKN